MKLIITVSQLYFQNIDAPIEIPILRDLVPHLARSPGTTGKALAKAVGMKRHLKCTAYEYRENRVHGNRTK